MYSSREAAIDHFNAMEGLEYPECREDYDHYLLQKELEQRGEPVLAAATVWADIKESEDSGRIRAA